MDFIFFLEFIFLKFLLVLSFKVDVVKIIYYKVVFLLFESYLTLGFFYMWDYISEIPIRNEITID